MLTEQPIFIDELKNRINERPLDSDSETAISRHLATACHIAAERLGLSREPLISAEGSAWVYSEQQGIWERLTHEDLITLAQLYDGPNCSPPGGKPRQSSIGWVKANNIAKSLPRLHDLQANRFFETPVIGSCFTNGFVKVDEHGVELLNHDPDNAARQAYDFDLDLDTEPPHEWIKFLKELWEPDSDCDTKILILQEFIGASMANIATTYQRALLLSGNGANGKSALSLLIGALLFPEDTVSYVSPRRWDRDYSLAQLRNARINLVTELPETNALDNTDTFKSVVSGDYLEARLPYCAPFTFRCTAGHILSCNDIPRTSDSSHGFFRRFIMLTFNQNFGNSPFKKTEEEIMEAIAPERSAIILWALNGAARLIRQGAYTQLSSHEKSVQDWRAASDSVYDFALTCLEYPSDENTRLSTIRDEFRGWARSVGRMDEISSRALNSRLKKIEGLTPRTLRTGPGYQCRVKPRTEWSESIN